MTVKVDLTWPGLCVCVFPALSHALLVENRVVVISVTHTHCHCVIWSSLSLALTHTNTNLVTRSYSCSVWRQGMWVEKKIYCLSLKCPWFALDRSSSLTKPFLPYVSKLFSFILHTKVMNWKLWHAFFSLIYSPILTHNPYTHAPHS